MATGGPHGLHDSRATWAPRRGDNALRKTPPNLSMRFWLRIDGRYAHVSATREKVRVGSGTRIPSGTTERERDRGRTPGVPYTSRITRHNNGSTRLARRHGGLGPFVGYEKHCFATSREPMPWPRAGCRLLPRPRQPCSARREACAPAEAYLAKETQKGYLIAGCIQNICSETREYARLATARQPTV